MFLNLPQQIYYHGRNVATATDRAPSGALRYVCNGHECHGETALVTHIRGSGVTTRRMVRSMVAELAFRTPDDRFFRWINVVSEGVWIGTSCSIGDPALSEMLGVEPPPECSVCLCDMSGQATECKYLSASSDPCQMVQPPCHIQNHAICKNCLRRHATNWHAHSIGPNNSDAVMCPHEGCHGRYLVSDLASILSPQNHTRLVDLQRRFERSGAIWCPRCTFLVKFDKQKLRDAAPGTVAAKCERCHGIWCFHCLRSVSPIAYMASGSGMPICQCGVEPDMPHPGLLNRYFRAPAHACGPLARNYELRVEDCVDQLERLAVSDEGLAVECTSCHTPMHRASACNEMTHCGIRRCNICGMSGLEHESVLLDHWDETGMHGCPRWNKSSTPFWNMMIPQHVTRCVEGECHDANRDCTDPAHAEYRAAVARVRRMRMFHSAIQSLDPIKRRAVMVGLRGPALVMMNRIQTTLMEGGIL